MSFATGVIVNLAGGVALLLWGVRMVRTGVVRAWGDRLRVFLKTRVDTAPSAVAAGLGATLLLQSSTATTLILAGFAGTGLVSSHAGLAALLGADLGSALVAGAFASLGARMTIAPPLLLALGYAVFTFSSRFRAKNAGRILMGLGLMFLALQAIVAVTAPMRDSQVLSPLLGAAAADPLIAMTIGALLAWLSHSSIAALMMVTTVAAHGLIGQEAALLLVLGINIGAGLPAVTATLGQTEAARRLPMANLICRTTFAMILAPFADGVAAHLAGTPLGVVSLAAPAAHIVFNLALVILLVPFSGLLMRLMERVIPDKPAPFDGLLEPRYLDKALLERPRLAMATVAAEIARMTEIIDRMLAIAADALTAADLESLKQLAELDDRLGLYRISIQNYLADITANEQLAPILRERALEAAMFVSNLEHAGDVIALALRERLRRRVKEAVRFRDEQSILLDRLIGHVRTSLKQSASVIAADDPEGARLLIRRKASFGEIERQILGEALALPKTNAADQLFVEIVRELHKVNSQAASAAYPIADRAGLLLASRMKEPATGR